MTKFVKTTLTVGAGIVVGAVGVTVANHFTDGAVFEAASNVLAKFTEKTQETVEAVADVTESAVDTVADVI